MLFDKSIDGLARAYPVIIVFSSILNSLITNTNQGYILSLVLLLTNLFNHIIKEYLFKPIMSNNYISIFGYGKRPTGAKNCGLFKDGRVSTSYGMPSGHSQTSTLFSTYLILNILNKDDLNIYYKLISIMFLVILPLLVMYSRVYWAKCHTLQQVIFGGVIGIILGYYVY